MKKVICIILTLLTIMSLTSFPSFAQSDNPTQFKNIGELRTTITKLYEENYDELVSLAKTLRPSITGYEYITYESNCGPCTTAFQKILYDNSIVTEANKSYIARDHIFNLLRTSFEGSPDIVSTIVIDTTYKQYVTNYYSTAGYDFDDITQDLPPILIYEYGDYNQLVSELSKAKSRLGSDIFTQMCTNVFQAECEYDYIPQDYQDIDDKPIMNYKPTFIEDLRSKSGLYNKELNETLILSSTTSDYQKQFVYDCNGVYRCYVSIDDSNAVSAGFNIVNDKNEIIFGAKEGNSIFRCVSAIPNTGFVTTFPEVTLMSKGSQLPLTMDTTNVFLPIMISIDLRAGEDTPAIYAYTISRVLPYGDVNSDGEVNVTDVTELQMAIAKHPDHALDDYEKETANTITDDNLNIFDATEISRYLAKYESEKCGQYMHFSDTLEFGCSKNIGYIDMTTNLTTQ